MQRHRLPPLMKFSSEAATSLKTNIAKMSSIAKKENVATSTTINIMEIVTRTHEPKKNCFQPMLGGMISSEGENFFFTYLPSSCVLVRPYRRQWLEQYPEYGKRVDEAARQLLCLDLTV